MARSTLCKLPGRQIGKSMSRMIENQNSGLTRDDLRKMKNEKKGPGRRRDLYFIPASGSKFTLN